MIDILIINFKPSGCYEKNQKLGTPKGLEN